MKPKLAFVWFIVSLALCALLVANWRTSEQRRVLLETVQLQLEKVNQAEKTARARNDELEKDARRLRAELRGAEVDLNSTRMAYNTALQMTNASPALSGGGTPEKNSGPRGMGAFLSNVMNDPEMRKAMEQQQRMGLDLVYGALYKQLQLTPEQQKGLTDALLSLQMTNMAQAGAMMDPANTNRTALAQKMAADRQAAEAKIKEVLGEEKYAGFQEYNQTVGERMMLDQFAKQAAVTPEQSEDLLGIMLEEKRNMQINTGQGSDPGQNMQAMFDGDAAERIFAQQEQVNERVMERAAQVLTPEQMQKFRPVLTNQLSMQRAGLKMARQMFAPSGK
jgi:hypothetical protein